MKKLFYSKKKIVFNPISFPKSIGSHTNYAVTFKDNTWVRKNKKLPLFIFIPKYFSLANQSLDKNNSEKISKQFKQY